MILTYEAFVARVEELGFMPLSHQFCPSLPHLTSREETPAELWHTGDVTDPWRWKDRAAEEGLLAYGCILGGHKGFVAPWLYPAFFAACNPGDLQDDWEAGNLSQAAWDLWNLFDKFPLLSTADARQQLHHKPSRIDAAIIALQKDYHITGAGSTQKTNRAGRPYGWQINQYSRVQRWANPQWLRQADEIDGDDAIEMILKQVEKLGGDRAMVCEKMNW